MDSYIFKLLEGAISSDWYRVNFSPACLVFQTKLEKPQELKTELGLPPMDGGIRLIADNYNLRAICLEVILGLHNFGYDIL